MSQNRSAQNSSAMIRTLTLIATIAGLLVVIVFELTRPIIAENQRIAVEQAIFQVIPSAVQWQEYRLSDEKLLPANIDQTSNGIAIYAGFNQQGLLAGIATEAAAQGYADTIRLLYGYNPECECITGIKILKSTETPAHGKKTDPWQIDAISGATVSSRAIGKALNNSAQYMLPRVVNQLGVIKPVKNMEEES